MKPFVSLFDGHNYFRADTVFKAILLNCFATSLIAIIAVEIRRAYSKNENGFYIWQKNNLGETTNTEGSSKDINFSINSNSNTNTFNDYFKSKILNGWDIETAIELTIFDASEVDSTISPDYDIFII